MNLAEIQSFRQVGKRLRNAREAHGMTLTAVAGTCGLAISELVRIENGELLGFKQVSQNTLSNAEIYAKALDVELVDARRQHAGNTIINAQSDDAFIPVFLRKK